MLRFLRCLKALVVSEPRISGNPLARRHLPRAGICLPVATAGMAFAFIEHQLVLEGAGAVGIGALLHHKVTTLGRNVAVVLSGVAGFFVYLAKKPALPPEDTASGTPIWCS